MTNTDELEGTTVVPRGLSKYRFRIQDGTVKLDKKKRMHHFTRGYSDAGPWLPVCEMSTKDFYAMLDGLDYLQRETDWNDQSLHTGSDRDHGGSSR